jgi:hypothetical protein
MDPVSAAIVAAIDAGVTAGVTSVGQNAVIDAYNALKTAIKRRFGKDSEVAKAVDGAEANPESKGRQAVLEEEVKKAGADNDSEVLQLAQALQDLLQGSQRGAVQNVVTSTGAGSAVSGSGNSTVTNTWGATPQESRKQP